MKLVGRILVAGTMACVAIGALALLNHINPGQVTAAQTRSEGGQWVDQSNSSDELVDGPYRVDPNWPKPLSTLFPEDKGWTWGAVQGIFPQNPDRIFVAMRGELPDLANAKKKYVEIQTAFGMIAHLEVPGRGMYTRNASVGPYASPGEASDDYMGVDEKDYQWKHVITVYDTQGNVKEAWTQWDSLFRPDNANVLSQGRVHKILINPYNPEKRVSSIAAALDVLRGIFRLRGTDGAPRSVVESGAQGLRFASDTELSSPSTGVLAVGGVPIPLTTYTPPVVAGTAFPTVGLVAGQRFFRTDLSMEFFWNGIDAVPGRPRDAHLWWHRVRIAGRHPLREHRTQWRQRHLARPYPLPVLRLRRNGSRRLA